MAAKIRLIRIGAMVGAKLEDEEKESSTVDEDIIYVTMSSGKSLVQCLNKNIYAESNGKPTETSSEIATGRTSDYETMEITRPFQTEEEEDIIESISLVTDDDDLEEKEIDIYSPKEQTNMSSFNVDRGDSETKKEKTAAHTNVLEIEMIWEEMEKQKVSHISRHF